MKGSQHATCSSTPLASVADAVELASAAFDSLWPKTGDIATRIDRKHVQVRSIGAFIALWLRAPGKSARDVRRRRAGR